MNSVELRDKINSLRTRCKEIVATCKKELREMTDEEQKEFDENKEEIVELKEELEELKSKLREYEDEIPEEEKDDDEELPEEEKDEEEEEKIEDEEEKSEDEEECKKRSRKNIVNNKKMNSIEKRFLQAVKKREYNRDINLNLRAVQVTGEGGTHDAVIEKEFTDILEPLYANSVLANLGVQMRTGLPMGDIQVPTTTKGTVGFLGEVDPAAPTSPTFGFKTLRPKRIAAYVDVSEQQLRQDTIGVFNSVQNNLVKKLDEYIQEVFFGSTAATDNKPAGIFYGATVTTVTDFADITAMEGDVEEANVYGDMKYVLNPKAKAAFRSMIKGTNATGMVYENGEMDGTPAQVTSSVPTNKFVYGNWSNILFATWGDTLLKIDDSINYVNGLVRVYLTAFVDWSVLRPEAFAFGTVSE